MKQRKKKYERVPRIEDLPIEILTERKEQTNTPLKIKIPGWIPVTLTYVKAAKSFK